MAGRIYEGLRDDYYCFLDSEADFDLHDLGTTSIAYTTNLQTNRADCQEYRSFPLHSL